MVAPAFRLKHRLTQASQRIAQKLGLGVSPGCQQLIEKMIANGVTRMQVQGALEREEQIQLAEDHLRRCLDALSEQAVTAGTFPQVDEHAFQLATKKLCPLWPYC